MKRNHFGEIISLVLHLNLCYYLKKKFNKGSEKMTKIVDLKEKKKEYIAFRCDSKEREDLQELSRCTGKSFSKLCRKGIELVRENLKAG